jgi:hypothetical protein
MEEQKKFTKSELLDMLNEMIKNIEALPVVAMTSYITHYDLYSALVLMSALFRADDCIDKSKDISAS